MLLDSLKVAAQV